VSVARVEVRRGGLIESEHRVHIAVADGAGRVRASAGDAARACFARSAIKAIQAIPVIEDGAAASFAMTEQEIALCCASHSGENKHVDKVAALLWRLGLGEEALACGPQVPFHEPSAEQLRAHGLEPSRLHNNCSGKHAGMLALARSQGWSTAGYHTAAHPVQRRMLEEVGRWCELPIDDIGTAVDGCGVVTFQVPLAALAGAFGRLARAARSGGNPAERVVQAMLRWPEYVAGTGRLCTRLMQVAGGRIFAKVGAEGMYCAGVPGAELGIALKVEDGAKRAAEPVLIAVLHALGLLSGDEIAELECFAEPDVKNTRGEVVGSIRAVLALEAH
jgi:L-asparaginase II